MAICKVISTVNLHSRFAYLCWVNNADFRICFQVSDVLKLSEQQQQQQRQRPNATLRNGNALVSSQQQQQLLQLPNLCNLRLLHKFFAVVSQQQQQQHADC